MVISITGKREAEVEAQSHGSSDIVKNWKFCQRRDWKLFILRFQIWYVSMVLAQMCEGAISSTLSCEQ